MLVRPLAALLLLAGALAAAVAASRGAALAPADFVMNNGAEVQTLDPAAVSGLPEGRVVRMLFEGLLTSHPETLAPAPGLAERWEVSADGLTVTFHLRRDARWSNGDPCDARDVVWSLERLLHPETAAEYAYQLWCVRGARDFTRDVDERGRPRRDFASVGIRAEDPTTVVFELERPTPYFLELVTHYTTYPVHRATLEAAQARWPATWRQEWIKPEHLVCNGPYVLELRRINDRLRVRKNPHYWDRDEVAFEIIDVLPVESVTTILNLYLTGAVHLIDRMPSSVLQVMARREDFQPRPYLGSYFYRVNTTRPPLDDPRVRRALSLVVPREAITAKVVKGGHRPSRSLVPDGIPGYAPATLGPSDPDAARLEALRLLAEAGYGPGGKALPIIELHYNTSEVHRDVALVVADAWSRELGLDARLLNQEWKVYAATQRALGYDVSRSSWIGDYADPMTFLEVFVSGGENNRTGWGDPRFDTLLDEAKGELDAARRAALLAEAEALLLHEAPVLPIYAYATQDAFAPRLGGYANNLKDEHFAKHWYWMDDAELAAKRAGYPADGRRELIPARGPRAGLYSPAERARRAAR